MKNYFLVFFAVLAFQYSKAQQERSKLNIPLQNLVKENRHTSAEVNLFVNAEKAPLIRFLSDKNGLYKYPAGEWHAIRLQINDVEDLSVQPWIRFIHYENYKGEMMNDTMRIRNNVDSVHAGFAPLHSPYKGKGVIAAFIDTGIDFNHGDFLDSLGGTRVLGVWDQTQPFDPALTPSRYGYGQVWDSTDINAGTCSQMDTYAHGTTVSGCTSGNGRETNAFVGLAPESSILIVKNDLGSPNWLTTIADAVDFLFYVADSLDMPCVINISLGTYTGSHDGRDPAGQFIDSLIRAKNGRLVSAAAGNSGNSSIYGNYHLETYVIPDTSFTWFSYNPSSSLGYGAVFFEVFADTAEFNNVFYAVGADNTAPYDFRGRTDFHSIGEHLGTVLTDTILNNGNILGIVDYYAELMGDVYLLQIHLQQPDSSQYNFRFMTTGSGRFDIWTATWLGGSGMINSGLPSPATFPAIDNYVLPDSAKVIVSSFTCLESVVTVANYNNYLNYVDYAGNMQVFPGNVGQISLNSSRGPTRDNRMKPEVAATGDLTMSAGPLASLAYMRVNEPWKVSPDGMHMRNGGTSMAAPVVAGVGVLMLEKCPELNWMEFRDALIATAKTDSFTGTVPNITYGNGKVNTFRAMVETSFTLTIIGDSVFCEGDSSQLSVPGVYPFYEWSSGETAASVFVDSSSIAEVFAIDSRGCKSDTATMNVTQIPSPSVPNIQLLTPTGTVLVFVTDSSATAYSWYAYESGAPVLVGSQDSIGFNTNTYGFVNSVNVFLEVTNANGCSAYSDTILVLINSVEENAGDNDLVIFPNPSEGIINIKIQRAVELISVDISDVTGKIVYSIPDEFLNNRMITINSSLPAGVYFIRFKTEEYTMVKQFVLVEE